MSRKVNLETGAIEDPGRGWIPYEISERIAICMESYLAEGMSEQEARRAAEKMARADYSANFARRAAMERGKDDETK